MGTQTCPILPPQGRSIMRKMPLMKTDGTLLHFEQESSPRRSHRGKQPQKSTF